MSQLSDSGLSLSKHIDDDECSDIVHDILGELACHVGWESTGEYGQGFVTLDGDGYGVVEDMIMSYFN